VPSQSSCRRSNFGEAIHDSFHQRLDLNLLPHHDRLSMIIAATVIDRLIDEDPRWLYDR